MNLTNVVWVEQPAGTGFSPVKSTPQATSEEEVAAQFLGFWKNFVDTFGLHNRKVYITGESYAGYYVPYIADAMHNETDTEYYGVEGIQFYDPVLSTSTIQNDIPTYPAVEHWAPVFNLNDSFVEEMASKFESCGYADYMTAAMTFPPAGPLPNISTHPAKGCDLWNQVTSAAPLVNPCWDVYDILTFW